MSKIAVIVDSGSDLPKAYCDRENVFRVPFRIIYKDREYVDGVTITATEVYQNLHNEVPKTSLPSGQDILDAIDKIKSLGYKQILIVSISSQLSGTYNMMSLMAKSISDVEIFVLDTKNIGIATGLFAFDAINRIEEGMDFKTLVDYMQGQIENCKVFFSVGTLEYLQKGGRIGLVSSLFGSALKIKPIITCNADGIYETLSKARGRKQSIEKMIDLAEKFKLGHHHYHVAICYGLNNDEYMMFKSRLSESVLGQGEVIEVELGAALGIHTGPELFGMAVYILPET